MKRKRDERQGNSSSRIDTSNHSGTDTQSNRTPRRAAATTSLAQRLGLSLESQATFAGASIHPSKKRKQSKQNSHSDTMSSMWAGKGPNRTGAGQPPPPPMPTFSSTRKQQPSSRRGGGGGTGGGGFQGIAVPGPIHNQKYLISTFEASLGAGRSNHQHAQRTAKYLENAKAVISNYMTALGEPVDYVGGKVTINGTSMFR